MTIKENEIWIFLFIIENALGMFRFLSIDYKTTLKISGILGQADW
jgi:hypothetical protein